MKRDSLREPERWCERAGGGSVEDAIGASLRRVRSATEPDAASVSQWSARMLTSRHRTRPAWSVLAVAGVALAGTGAVAARAITRYATSPGRSAAVAEQGASAPARARHPAPRTGAARPTPNAEPATPAPVLPPDGPPAVGSAIALPTARPRPRLPDPPAAASLVTEPDESALVARAFRHLRTGSDPAAALASLDEHGRRFPNGGLHTEAALARAEALLALGRADDALAALLAIRDPGARLTRDVRVARAELLAKAGRCDDARPDLEGVLAVDAEDGARERALYARASCRLASGDRHGAAADFATYIDDYPDGRLAASARRHLDVLRRP